ncbi:MAG: heavy metal translocating P-type ATPase, partial [Treponema sp.]|nr:heavy metal translocating P-type ATPase [Treponema sp.]
MTRKSYTLDNLCCPKCAAKIEKHVAALDGVNGALVDFAAQKLIIEANEAKNAGQWDDIMARAGGIIKRLEPAIELRDTALFPDKAAAKDKEGPAPLAAWLRRGSLGLGMALFAAGMAFEYVPSATLPPFTRLALFLVSYILVGGQVLVKAAKNSSKGEIFDENFLMGIATIGAFAIGEYPEGAAVMIFYRVGEAFQNYAVGRSRKSIAALMDIRPDYANLKTAAGLERVSPETVRVGSHIVVKPGEKIPLDGVVAEGFSALDTSALTGESLPRDVEKGSAVLSG